MRFSRLLKKSHSFWSLGWLRRRIGGGFRFQAFRRRFPRNRHLRLRPCRPSQLNDTSVVFAFHAAGYAAEREFTVPSIAEGDMGRFDEIEIAALPKNGLDDTPFADYGNGHAICESEAVSSLGKRTRS